MLLHILRWNKMDGKYEMRKQKQATAWEVFEFQTIR